MNFEDRSDRYGDMGVIGFLKGPKRGPLPVFGSKNFFLFFRLKVMGNGEKMSFIDILRIFDLIQVFKIGKIRLNMRFFSFFKVNVDFNDVI